jgi:membrane dipeptidase
MAGVASGTRARDGVRAEAVYRSSVVIDGSIAPLMDASQVDRMVASGVTTFVWTVCKPLAHLPDALVQMAAGLQFIDSQDRVRLVRTVSDIEACKRDGRVGLIFGPQSPRPVEYDLGLCRILKEVGVRVLQLTYNERNLFGDGCTEPANGGLSNLGRQLIAELNLQGIVVDLSHVGEQTILDAIAASEDPVIISHSNAKSVHDSQRNVSDEVLTKLAAAGGVIGLTFWSPMVGSRDGQPTMKDFLKHVDHVASLIGPEHIALGSDHSENTPRAEWDRLFSHDGEYSAVARALGPWYGYDTRFFKGGSSCGDFPGVADGLASLGFNERELGGILGGNLMRVFGKVWDA